MTPLEELKNEIETILSDKGTQMQVVNGKVDQNEITKVLRELLAKSEGLNTLVVSSCDHTGNATCTVVTRGAGAGIHTVTLCGAITVAKIFEELAKLRMQN